MQTADKQPGKIGKEISRRKQSFQAEVYEIQT